MNWSSLVILPNVIAQLSHSGYPRVGREQKDHHPVQKSAKEVLGTGMLAAGEQSTPSSHFS